MNTSYEKLSFYNTFFGGSIDGDNIISTDFYGNKQIVGVTQKKYQETLDLLNTYYNKLVEVGVIQKEKTPEEIANEQKEMMSAMIIQMKNMQEALDNLQKKNLEKEEHDELKSNNKHINTKVESELQPTGEVESSNTKGERSTQFNFKPRGGNSESQHRQ